jgi:transcription termination/antitermination protein NusG
MHKGLGWYAVYTRPRWEKKVAELLTKRQIENYCPLQKVERRWSDRKKMILEPLFKSYVFVRIIPKGQVEVMQTDGVVNFITFLNKPALIRDEEIEIIKQFLRDYENIEVERTDLNVNDQVKIISGPLMEQKGSVLEVSQKTVKVLLPSLGFALVAIGKSDLEKDNNN